MRCISYAVACAAIAAVSSAALAAPADFRVNGQLVTKAQQEEILDTLVQRGQTRSPQLEEQVRQLLIRDTVILQEARSRKLEERADVQREIENAKSAILAQTLLRDWVRAHPVPQSEIAKAYDDQVARLGTKEVLVRHIVVKDEARARELLAKVKGGADMARLARENTIDTAQNKASGGLIQWMSPKLFDPEFAKALSGLKKGAVCGHVIKTRVGWHVVRLENERTSPILKDLQTATPFLERALLQRAEQQYVQKLVSDAKISPDPAKKGRAAK